MSTEGSRFRRRDRSSGQRQLDGRSIADVQRSEAGCEGAIDLRNDGNPTDASSQMSTTGSRVEKTRWVFETTMTVRTLYRGCQRTEVGSRGCDKPPRQRSLCECFIAVVNARELSCEGAMGHRDDHWRECSLVAVNALRKAPRGKRPRSHFFSASVHRCVLPF
jgi:hypothetical protein